MTTQTTGDATAERQRARSLRGVGRPTGGAAPRQPSPPRQRRPALAALAVLLIVGGALLAGLLALRMDARQPVLAAATEIPAGTEITAADLRVVHVAPDQGVPVVAESQLDDLLSKTPVARTLITKGQLLNGGLFVDDDPLAGGRFAMVSVLLTPGLAPRTEIREGDIVLVTRAAQESGTDRGRAISEGYVHTKTGATRDDFGGGSAGSVTLLVPQEAAQAVVDAAGANRAGLAILSRDNGLDGLSLAVAGN